ncbi:hypothetical protein [Ramlibacter sp.]|uniref:hypothetical protein n=1 Tax=Ramlibacter sp. TaxID=1917967 RepID=UPI003D0CE08D
MNWETFLFFLSLTGQWNMLAYTEMRPLPGGNFVALPEIQRAGLPAERVESSLRLQCVARARRAEMYADVLRMERAVLERDAELRAERAQRE